MYLIVGANGFIGSYAIKQIIKRTNDKILAADINIIDNETSERVSWVSCDVTNHRDILKINELCMVNEPVKIIYLAAYHAPDKVRENPQLAWNINITALADFVNTIENVKCLFYSSTEMVYGEGNMERRFSEKDLLCPVNEYGRQKVVAEAIVKGYGYNCVRFPFLIGPSLLSGKKHFYDVIVDSVKNGTGIEMFQNAYKTALDFDTVTYLLISLIEIYNSDMPKIINIAGDEVLNKYEIGLNIARANGLNEELIKPISLYEDKGIFKERRADCTLLDNSLLKEVLNLKEIKMLYRGEIK